MSDTRPTRIENQPPIAETVDVEILAASVANKDAATLSIRVKGAFERPGARVTIEPVVIVATVPAKVLP